MAAVSKVVGYSSCSLLYYENVVSLSCVELIKYGHSINISQEPLQTGQWRAFVSSPWTVSFCVSAITAQQSTLPPYRVSAPWEPSLNLIHLERTWLLQIDCVGIHC